MTRSDKIKAVKEMIINDIIGVSAMENWGVKSLEGEGFLQTHEIASNRFRRLAEKIVDSIGVDEEGIYWTMNSVAKKNWDKNLHSKLTEAQLADAYSKAIAQSEIITIKEKE